jgi:hypothetical protein
LNKRETTLKNEVPKLSTHSELYYTFWAIFCVLFHFDSLPGSKDIGITFQMPFIYSLCENLHVPRKYLNELNSAYGLGVEVCSTPRP